jgi:DNA helicase II / ATP-dependent DNA helicase PcrA
MGLSLPCRGVGRSCETADMVLTAEQVLAGLDPEQREVAVTLKGPVVVLAGAGSGKTRAITHRIAHAALTGVHDPRRTLAVTFTTRAAGEMRSRLSALGVSGVQARTFHSAALRQLQFFWRQVLEGEPPRLVDRKASIVAEAAGLLGLPTDAATVRDLASEIEWSKAVMLAAEQYPTRAPALLREAPAGLDVQAVARVIDTYAELTSSRRLMDFEDVLLLLVGLLDSEPAVLEAVHQQYRHFTVDEYQDVNPLQQRLLDLWVGDRDDICVVGDAAQTIYTFAGASPTFLEGFASRHRHAAVINLTRCYRCTPQVVSLANRLIPRSSRRSSLSLISQRPAGPKPRLRAYSHEIDEAEGIAASVAALVGDGVSARDIAILYRINAQSEVFEDALTHSAVAYTVKGGERFFDRSEVRQALVLLRGARAGGVDQDVPLPDQVRAALSPMNIAGVAPSGRGAARERWESISALLALVDDLVARDPAADLNSLLMNLEERATAQHAPSVDGVTLATFHAAKGLEWKHVFIAGLVDGTVPITYATTPAAIDEEKRLLYVAVTRAADEVTLSWSKARTPGQRPTRVRSRFLEGLESGVLEVSGDPTFEQ